jgi:hypothetical protein
MNILKLVSVFAILFAGVASAQGSAPALPSLEAARAAWGDLINFSGLVVTVIAFARAHVPFVANLKGIAVVGASVVVGAVLGLIGSFVFGPTAVVPFASIANPFGSVLFGVAGGLAASGFVDLVKAVLGVIGGSAKAGGNVKTDAARGRSL